MPRIRGMKGPGSAKMGGGGMKPGAPKTPMAGKPAGGPPGGAGGGIGGLGGPKPAAPRLPMAKPPGMGAGAPPPMPGGAPAGPPPGLGGSGGGIGGAGGFAKGGSVGIKGDTKPRVKSGKGHS